LIEPIYNFDHLPPSISHIQFPSPFNDPLHHLPPSIAHLTLPSNYRQPLDHLPGVLVSYYN
jgi:hypothetical protein